MNRKIKIAHSLDELEDQVILTIKDRPILANGQIDDDVDILQNDEMQITNEAKYNSELKGRLKNIADAASSHLEAKNEGNTDILPHYNDYSYRPETIEVEEGAVIRPRKIKKGRVLGEDYAVNEATKLNSEYTSKQVKKGNSKKSTRELLSFLEETAEDDKVELKREWQGDIVGNSLDQIKKKRVLDNQIRDIVRSQPVKVEDEEQSLLLQSIERSRRKVQRDRREGGRFSVLESIKEEDAEGEQPHQKLVQIEMNPIAYKSSDGMRTAKDIQIKQVVTGTTSAMFVHLPSERLARKAEPKQQQLPESFNELSKEELSRMRDEVQFLQEKEVGTGLAGTLQFLRENDLLGKEEQVGRYNDKEVLYNDPNDKIRLQYRNASGKLMKPKEAFRYICAKFHGEGPGKNKVEMRKRRELEELRMKESQNSGGKLLGLLSKHQQQSGEAHMVLNMGGKADPGR